ALWRRTYSERLKPRRFCHCRFMPIAAAGRGDAVAMDTEIEMKWKRNGRAGRGVISIKAAGKPLYTEKLDITDRDARNRLIQSICERGNGIDRVALVEQLEAFASESVDDGDDAQ